MTEKKDVNNRKPQKHSEPKISELEKWLDDFRHTHGHEKLIEEIKSITKIYTHKEKSTTSKDNELKISEIEKIFHLFSEEHGHEKLKKSLEEATRGVKKEKQVKQNEHVVYTDKNLKKYNANKVDAKGVVGNIKHYTLSFFTFVKEKMEHKKYRYSAITLGAFLVIYLIFNLPVIYSRISWQKPEETQKVTVRTEEVVQRQMADSAALSPGEIIPSESRIVIPKIKVNAPVVFADTKDEKSIENLLRSGVVHYQDTAKPGEVGNSFITGHSSNYWWDTGKYNYVFVMLDKLEPGDQAVIYYNGKKFVYTVRDKVVVEATDVSVLAPTDTPMLTLMTCTPPGTSWKRLIVRLDRTDPAYYKPETVTKEKVLTVPKVQEKKKSFFENILSFFVPN